MSKKKTYAVIVAVSLIGTLIIGTFAWTNFGASIINSFFGQGRPGGDDNGNGDNGQERLKAPGGTLHNDYVEGEPYRDIYIENWGTEPMIVRIRLAEYMEIGPGAGNVNGLDNNQAVSLVSGAALNDVETWTPFNGNLDDIDIRHANSDNKSFRDYWRWTMGGQKFYFPAPLELRGTVDENGVDFVSTRSPAFISGSALDLAAQTISPDAEVKTMAQWVSEGEPVGNFWVVDTDGFSYWAAPLEPREATSLLLHKVELIENPTYDYFYGIHVDGQMATIDDAPDNYERFLNNASDEATRLINRLADEIRGDVEYIWLTEEMIREAEEAVTPELRARIAQIERERDEFFTDITFERIWDMLLYEHPYRFEQMTEDEILSKKQEREARHEEWALFMEEGYIDDGLTMYSSGISPSLDLTGIMQDELQLRRFIDVLSLEDGISFSDLQELQEIGDRAAVDAWLSFRDTPDEMKRDAYRHYIWNFRGTRATSERAARIYTTNRELVSNMLRQHSTISTDTAVEVRNNKIFNLPYSEWNALFTGSSGRDDLMDLWNNEQGRRDGSDSSLSDSLIFTRGRFNRLFDSGALVRNNSAVQLPPARRFTIWEDKLYRPVYPLPVSVVGRVVDDVTGEPITGAIVVIVGTNQRRTTVTDQNGQYRFNLEDLSWFGISIAAPWTYSSEPLPLELVLGENVMPTVRLTRRLPVDTPPGTPTVTP